MSQKSTIAVIGATGKTGRRVADRLTGLGHEVRIGSRQAESPFVWEEEASWQPLLDGVDGVYIAHPDNTHPDAGAQIGRLAKVARDGGAKRQVLLSGRADEGFMDTVEAGFRASGADWTILRPAWFMQNFSEMFFVDGVLAGELVLPVGEATEPFIDVEDVAAVAVAALLDGRHAGQIYELTGPELLGFEEAARALSKATGRKISFVPISLDAYREGIVASGLPEEYAYTYSGIANGKLAYLTDDVERVLGRKPRRFADYARDAAASGVWAV
ncbi:NmrA family NAD(P)-binding protein [Sphingobium agri]|uniref:NAD(P)H-binding protein n=1 Tax=Sphingobium agri TaxID=2933566 RepID=A0ABT0E018_9SPHN|nr:NmrA family NAD(P)-binding protein [Sphingobium agri]MCK0532716.1 NAD(P)H-binding protein [Sphingobium agri]